MLPSLGRLTGAASSLPCERTDEPDPREAAPFAAAPFHFSLPHGVLLHEAAAVAVDAQDRVHCFNRGNVPVLVFDPNGQLVHRWGNPTPFAGAYATPDDPSRLRWRGSEFVTPHGITIDADGHVWLVDVGAHTISKCTTSGERLLMIVPGPRPLTDGLELAAAVGRVHKPAPLHGGAPFNQPCSVEISRRVDGLAYVCDGYGNSRVHAFDKRTGVHRFSWGTSGTQAGMFNLPHAAALHYGDASDGSSDRLLVADRENHRVQIFAPDGTYLEQWRVHRPSGIRLATLPGCGDTPFAFVCQLAASHKTQRTGGAGHLDQWTPSIGNCVTVHTLEGTILHRIGAPEPSDGPEGLIDPHGVAVDSTGAVYTANVAYHGVGAFRAPVPYQLLTLKRFSYAPLALSAER